MFSIFSQCYPLVKTCACKKSLKCFGILYYLYAPSPLGFFINNFEKMHLFQNKKSLNLFLGCFRNFESNFFFMHLSDYAHKRAFSKVSFLVEGHIVPLSLKSWILKLFTQFLTQCSWQCILSVLLFKIMIFLVLFQDYFCFYTPGGGGLLEDLGICYPCQLLFIVKYVIELFL